MLNAEDMDNSTVTHSKVIQLEKEAQSDVKYNTEAVQQLQADFTDLVHKYLTLNQQLESQNEYINQLDFSSTQLQEEFQSNLKVEADTVQQLQADLKQLSARNDICQAVIKKKDAIIIQVQNEVEIKTEAVQQLQNKVECLTQYNEHKI